MKNNVYLSIGTNLGNREDNLQEALNQLRSKVEIVKVSSIYETEPVGGVQQDDFLNIAVKIKTEMNPYQLLKFIHQIESELHRVRTIHWGPRTIDLDILYFNNIEVNDDQLIIPHPEIKNRNFVLIPMLEITNNDNIVLRDKILKMIEKTDDKNSVQKYKSGVEHFE